MLAPLAELPADIRDLHVDRALVGGTREDAAAVGDELHEQLELSGGQVDRPAAQGCGAIRLVDPEPVEIDALRDGKPASEDGADAREEDETVEGLGDIVIRSG